jgi:hypothetical protein
MFITGNSKIQKGYGENHIPFLLIINLKNYIKHGRNY